VRQEADRAEKLVRAALHEFDAARDGEMADRARNLLNEMAAGRATRAAAIAADMPADAPPGLQEVARRLITETLEVLGLGLAARGGDADSVVTCAYGTESGAGRRMRQSDNTRYRRADSWYPSHMAGAA
jgi:hypothetical protein